MPKLFGKKKNNNRKEHKISTKAEIVLIAIVTTALVFLGWAYILQETAKYKESITESFGSNQEFLVGQAAKSVTSEMRTHITEDGYSFNQAEQAAVKNVINKAETSGSRYWFFYSADKVIFERDREATRNVLGKSMAEVIQYWKMQGGTGLEAFRDMLLDGRNGSIILSKGSTVGDEIVSVKYFTVDGKGYYLGMSTLKTYVLTTARVNEHILYLWTFSALVSLNIIIFSLLMCLGIYRNKKESNRLIKSVSDKNLQIQELNSRLTSKTEAAQNASIYDNLTKLYNRQFFGSLLARIDHTSLKPMSIAILDINALKQLNAMQGYEAGDDILKKTSEILNRICLDTDIVAKTGSSEFSILMTSTNETEAYVTVNNIKRQFDNLKNSELMLSMGVAVMDNNENSILNTLTEARNNLILDKMLNKSSMSSSIISMMMLTLGTYSKETVEHSMRLRDMAITFGKHYGMKPSSISRLAHAAQLHDVGKIGISDSILNKTDVLGEHDREVIRRHPELGCKIVKAIPVLNEVALDILQHHEAYDGTGYPGGLRGEEITLNARIINILDSFDAMTNKRAYKTTMTVEEAIEELRMRSSHQFDPHIVNDFIKVIENEQQEDRKEHEYNQTPFNRKARNG